MSNISLVERLKFWRAERPDEWQMDEFIWDAKKLEQERNELTAQVERLRSEFPLFDDDGLCEHEHHCEFTLLQERKRLHKILSETPPAALAALKVKWQGEAVKEFLEMLDESIGVDNEAGRNVSGDTIEMIGRAARKFKQRA